VLRSQHSSRKPAVTVSNYWLARRSKPSNRRIDGAPPYEVLLLPLPARNGGEILARVEQPVSRRMPAIAATFGRPSMRRPAGVKPILFFSLFFLFASIAEVFVARRFSQERAGFARRSALLTGSQRHGLITQRSKEKRFSTRTPHRFPFHTHSQCGL